MRRTGWLEVVRKRDGAEDFGVLPRRWVVERTFAWLGRQRRLSKDYERKAQTGETMIQIATSRLMLARLARAPWPFTKHRLGALNLKT